MALETANPALSIQRNVDRPVISGQVLRPAQPGIKLTVRGRRLVALLALLPIVAAQLSHLSHPDHLVAKGSGRLIPGCSNHS